MIPTHTPDQAAAAVTQQAETMRREQEATTRRVEDLIARGVVCRSLRRDSGRG